MIRPYELGIRIVIEPYLANPYPEPVDNGSWEDDGGYVAQPNHLIYGMKFATSFFYRPSQPEHVIVCHPLTYSEIEYSLNKDKRVSNGQ